MTSLSNWADHITIEGKLYYFASRNKACEELPILTSKPDTMYRHYKSLRDLGLIEIEKVSGKDYIRFTSKSASWGKGTTSEGSEKNPNELGKKSESDSEKNPTYKNTIIDKNTSNNIEGKSKRFTPPPFSELMDYFFEKLQSNDVAKLEAEKFQDFYQTKGWMVGKNKMKDWKAAVRNWLRRKNENNNGKQKTDLFSEDQVRYRMERW